RCVLSSYRVSPHLRSFPTRRSSDLCSFSFRRLSRSFLLRERARDTSRDRRRSEMETRRAILHLTKSARFHPAHRFQEGRVAATADRKSTRLNSSHQIISYAVFCLKK